MYLNQYLQDQNFLALIAAAAAYWSLGALWFGPIFGKSWSAEWKNQGTTIERPDGRTMAGMMIGHLIYVTVITFALSYIVFITGCIMIPAAVKMGGLIGLCISFASLASTYIWTNRSWKLLMLDGLYHTAGVMCATLILSQWR